MTLARRVFLNMGSLALAMGAAGARQARAETLGAVLPIDPLRTELVMNLLVTCGKPQRMGPSVSGPDGMRDDVWPIIGGRFEGPRLRGIVIPGGGDFPVERPDGVGIIDALYRLRTDDGTTIIIHNRGLDYGNEKYRLAPEFIVTKGPHDWLNKSIFLSTLVDVPPKLAMARGPDENDRLIQVYRVY
jgi:hypothetical protein